MFISFNIARCANVCCKVWCGRWWWSGCYSSTWKNQFMLRFIVCYSFFGPSAQARFPHSVIYAHQSLLCPIETIATDISGKHFPSLLLLLLPIPYLIIVQHGLSWPPLTASLTEGKRPKKMREKNYHTELLSTSLRGSEVKKKMFSFLSVHTAHRTHIWKWIIVSSRLLFPHPSESLYSKKKDTKRNEKRKTTKQHPWIIYTEHNRTEQKRKEK